MITLQDELVIIADFKVFSLDSRPNLGLFPDWRIASKLVAMTRCKCIYMLMEKNGMHSNLRGTEKVVEN
jgi:hypothetical protein